MKLQWSHILVPLGAGIASSVLTSAKLWIEASPTLLSVVSIVSAGVLVRLARGVPFSAIDVLDLQEARKLSTAIKLSVRALRALLLVCFLTIICLVFVAELNKAFSWINAKGLLPFSGSADYVALIVPMLLTFVFMRTHAVVEGDIQIADIQADILIKKRGKDAANAFQKNVAGPAKESYRQPHSYGGVIENEQV